MEISNINIEKVRKLKGHRDFYQSMIDKFYNDAAELLGFENDYLFDWFNNDFGDLEEILENEGLKPKEVQLSLDLIRENDDGSATYSFEVGEKFRKMAEEQMGVKDISDEDLGDFILSYLEEITKDIE